MDRGSWRAARYDAARERAWHLSILIANDLQAWAATDLGTAEVVALGWDVAGNALDASDVPAQPPTVSFVTLPEWSALVPEGALMPGTEAQHLSLVHGKLPTGALRDEPVASLGATCIYVHDDEAERTVLDRFPHARPVPMQGLMVRGALARANEAPALLLHRGHDRLDAVVADRGRVLLSNTYPARASQDMLYYALLAVEGCGLRPGDAVVHHGGTHLTAHERDLVHRYFGRGNAAIEAWPELNSDSTVDPSRWLAVLEQFACVS